MPVQYLNIYLIGFLGSVVAVIVGIGFSYSGMSELGFSVYRGMEMTTYYLDKNRYDLYMNAMVYCITFGAALMLILAVILIPSAQQVQKRMSATPYGTPAIGTPPSGIEAPPMEMEIPSYEEPQMTPELEDYSEDEGLGMAGLSDGDDSDVVSGNGRITDESHESFIRDHTESAVKFLIRKDLDDSELKPEDEQVHEEWQKRGLSRGKLRKHVMKMMDWDNIPEVAVDEILSQIREKISS